MLDNSIPQSSNQTNYKVCWDSLYTPAHGSIGPIPHETAKALATRLRTMFPDIRYWLEEDDSLT
jgi:hypothetical protein